MMTTFFAFFPAMLLSGFAFPIANMPEAGAVADAGQPAALFPGDRAEHLPEGRGHGDALAADAPAAG